MRVLQPCGRVPHNQLVFLHLANQRTLCLVLQRHGPFGQLAQLGAIVHEGMRDVAALLAARQPYMRRACSDRHTVKTRDPKRMFYQHKWTLRGSLRKVSLETRIETPPPR